MITENNKFTDDEKRLFLSAMRRERQRCEETDLQNSLIMNRINSPININVISVTDLCKSVENKVMNILF